MAAEELRKKELPPEEGEDGGEGTPPEEIGGSTEEVEHQETPGAPDAELEGAADDAEREAIRERRRQERRARKEHARQREDESRRLIASLRRENEQMQQRLAAVEQRNAGTDLAQLDYAISQAAAVAEEAKRRIQAATEASDGKALAEANEVYYAARRRTEDLGGLKGQIVQARSRPQAPRLDPSLVQQTQAWMQRHPWYDVSGKNVDSRVAMAVDEELSSAGWDPRTPEYWEQLDTRLKNYLPHRYQKGYNKGGGSATSEGTAASVVGGSGRESGALSGGDGGTHIPREYVDALKDAGMWDDPKLRAKMIQKYKEGRKNVA